MTIKQLITQTINSKFIKTGYSEQHKYFLTYQEQEWFDNFNPKFTPFKTICDGTNNTPENIKAGMLSINIVFN